MPELDGPSITNSIVDISSARSRLRGDGGSDSGGGDPPDIMNARIEKLEAQHEAIRSQLNEVSALLRVIDAKLDGKAAEASVTGLDGKVQSVRDAINTRASQAELNLLQGSVKNLPTTTQLILFAVAIFVAAGVTRYFGH